MCAPMPLPLAVARAHLRADSRAWCAQGAYYGCGLIGCSGPRSHGPMHKVIAALRRYHKSIGLPGDLLYDSLQN